MYGPQLPSVYGCVQRSHPYGRRVGHVSEQLPAGSARAGLRSSGHKAFHTWGERPAAVDFVSQVLQLGAWGYYSARHFEDRAPGSSPSSQGHCLRLSRLHLQPVICESPADLSYRPVRSDFQIFDHLSSGFHYQRHPVRHFQSENFVIDHIQQ